MSHFSIQKKLAQHCKSTLLQFKKRAFKGKRKILLS